MQDQSPIQRLRAFAIGWITPIAWRASARRQAAALQKFSRVEYDSGWQALRVLPTQTDPDLQAGLFVTALEEFHHATLFKTLLANHPAHGKAADPAPRLSIWDREPDIKHFLAAQYVGETSVHSEFEIYAKAAGSAEIARTFHTICEDEEKHGRDAFDNLVAAIGSRDTAETLIRKVRRSHDWRAVSSAMEPVGSTISRLLLVVLYVVFGLFLAPFARRRLARS